MWKSPCKYPRWCEKEGVQCVGLMKQDKAKGELPLSAHLLGAYQLLKPKARAHCYALKVDPISSDTPSSAQNVKR